MRVTVAAGGRFWALHLAHQLWKRRCLARVVTTLPSGRIGAETAPGVPFVSVLGPEVLMRLAGRVPWARASEIAELWKARWFGWSAQKYIAECDILHVFANFALEAMSRPRAGGTLTILDRASAHAAVQRRLLEEEYRRFGVNGRPVHPALETRALREYEQADFILVPSTFVRATFVACGFDPAKLLLAPLGVDPEMFPAGRPDRRSPFRVLFVGGINLRKGIPYLLEAMGRLPRETELVLAGVVGSEMRGVLGRYTGPFTLLGPLRQSALSTVYRQASVLVLPSVEDGFGLVVLEAMASGLPVVVSANAGASDVIREGVDGFVVPARDVDALADRLGRLQRSPDLAAEMGENARRRAVEFSWDAYGDSVAAAYELAWASRGAVSA